MTKIVCIIQARMGSTRFPGKVLKQIRGKSVLYYVVERLKNSSFIDQIVVATTGNKRDDVIVEETKRLNIEYFRGDEEDVLSRYYHAAKEFNADIIVRVTSDCPLIDSTIVDELISYYLHNTQFDLVTNAGIDNSKRTYPRGLDAEIISMDALSEAFFNASKRYQREHVSPYIYENQSKYNVYHMPADFPLNRPDIRITIDYEEDFKLVEKIFNHFNELNFTTEFLIKYLDKNPKLLDINKKAIQKPIHQ